MVEDSEADAELLLYELAKSGYELSTRRVDTARAMREALETEPWDLVLSDYNMPAFTAPQALRVLAETGLDIPFIIVSGTIGEDAAVASLKAGACDFLVKGRLARLVPAIEREMREADLRRDRARAHAALQEELRQAQKLEAIGQLAGTVAHDFNNMLTAILGYAELLTEQIGPDKPIGRDIQEIVNAAERAASLTRQLLAFGRKQAITPIALSVNGVAQRLEPMLRRLIKENIEIRLSLDPDTRAVLADETQVEQVLLNLALNGRDAMPRGGVLTIETRAARVENDTKVPAGEYVVVRVSDTGIGMSHDVQAHIFEPFYTTKARGRGTGLGLAAVGGIVKQLEGYISVASEPGRGTLFTIHLPAADRAAPEIVETTRRIAVPVGHETILLVEDEPSVRGFARTILTRHGYHVVDAESSEAAVAELRAHAMHVDLLLTDVMLSGKDGGELASDLRREHPELPVLFISGYADPFVRPELPNGCEMLAKPFTAHTLLWRVRDALGRHQPAT
jgi:two-component system, cell cycle sensor histidine kinase and response regulator CckA